MSKKFKSQASSSRAASSPFGAASFGAFTQTNVGAGNVVSSLSYIFEPPDLSLLSHPQVVVAFKNLLKKDSTTKTKALEDLLNFVRGSETQEGKLEDGFLDAWAILYPRISIDVSRRVRQLSHTLQGHIVSTTGKRIARYIPRLIGAWLAGLYDNDKLAVKAAQDSIIRAFPAEDKRQSIWKVYQSSILEFVLDATVQQTPLTLSDERTVRPDEANAKHARVVATAFQMLHRLLVKSPGGQLQKDSLLLQSLFESRTLWKFACHEDSFVRRSFYELCQTSISIIEGYSEWKTISTQLLAKPLAIDQHGSANEYSGLLLKLTHKNPQIWTDDYSDKTSASKRLVKYIKRGSQGGSTLYWQNLRCLLQCIPAEILLENSQNNSNVLEPINSVMEAFLGGILNREGARSNIPIAWSAFVETASWISDKIERVTDRLKFTQEYLLPIPEHYVISPSQQSKWAIQDKCAVDLCTQCLVFAAKATGSTTVCEFWTRISVLLSESVKLSAPAQAQTPQASQDLICLQSKQFFSLQTKFLRSVEENRELSSYLQVSNKSTVNLFETSLEALKSRDGNPYGAASVIKDAVINSQRFLSDIDSVEIFLADVVPDLALSPSSNHLVSALFACRQRESFQTGLKKLITAFQMTPLTLYALSGLETLFSLINTDDLRIHPKLESLIMKKLEEALHGEKQIWASIAWTFRNPAFSNGISSRVLSCLAESLSMDEAISLEALCGLADIVTLDCVTSFATGSEGSSLISKLLFLSESPNDEISHRANALQVKINRLINSSNMPGPTVGIIENSFEDIEKEPLSIDALVAIAQQILDFAPDQKDINLSSLFPNESQWTAALKPFLQCPLPPSFSIMSSLGGAVFLVNQAHQDTDVVSLPRDSNQLPLATRLALFVTKLLAATSIDDMEPQLQQTLFLYLPLVIQLVEDDLNVECTTTMLPLNFSELDSPESRNEFVSFVSEGRLRIKQWINKSMAFKNSPNNNNNNTDIVTFWHARLEKLQGNTPEAYRLADAYTRIMAEKESLENIDFAESALEMAQQLNGSANPFVLPAVVASFKASLASSPAALRLCNQLVAQITGLDELSQVEGLQKLITLNVVLQGDGNFVEKIPTQRLVFLVKHLMRCMQSTEFPLEQLAEAFKILAAVFPQLKEIYGSHWADSFTILDSFWKNNKESDEYLSALHASLRLFNCLRNLAINESNDDLEDAWVAVQKGLVEVLIHLLCYLGPLYNPNVPWNITIDLLDRQIKQLNVDYVEDISGLFSSLSIRSGGIQRAAYDVLRRVIPKSQETLSLDVALSGAIANLPDELLSLLLDVPSSDILLQHPIHEDNDDIWMDVRCYLLSWKVVFDHFAFASLPVQERYSMNIKENNCLDPLLDFTFEILQLSQGRLVDASKIDIRSFQLDESESLEKEIQWLLTNVYYLCLRYLPNLTKTWWVDSKKRVKGPVEGWTQKFVSPLVIEDSLQNVAEWFDAQDWNNEEQALQVKISYKVAEIVASIEIDEESPATSISISLPPTYPLQPAMVTGRYRVVVDERKWKSWLMSIQGVIMFSNGKLVDGLLAFRKNVQGALKGQGECAICYSVISADMQTPNKKCATCKNTFHSDCRNGAGRASRFRGRGGADKTSHPYANVSAKDKVIQQTDYDASMSRLSAVELGYLDDPFAGILSGIGREDAPRRLYTEREFYFSGTYVRTTAIDILISHFLAPHDSNITKRRRQIISLGAGTDTRAFRLLSQKKRLGATGDLVYHELDFPTNTTAKISTIRQSRALMSTLESSIGGVTDDQGIKISEAADALHSTYYHIHPVDLRTLSSLPSCETRFEGIDTTLPTLIISECCLIYLSPTDASNVLAYFTTLFTTSQPNSLPPSSTSPMTPLALVIYEPIRPHDPFGKTMVTNLATRGIHLQTLNQYATLSLQKDRLRSIGLVAGQGASDVDFLWEKWISSREKERVAALEMVDEVEEWRLLARHYCVAWGWREGKGDAESQEQVFGGWTSLEGQEGDEV
ncbi:hypothetical protein LOZ57_003368 [Ophidiomyces ophidiicola]|uniref:uncharacterized protein n=1 Tax=Ophidiomyces ophidiicola TaxID=1387563 RepID=UPI0020C20EB3|nr:uncharacterized protein LOZ57_003368 [Ophidiomyces ophidiicola]KAI1947130.1 hypothetical protein LOZ57_003368 [Ophidiomyces ophidiicola]KAI2062501.1 hypothetical protein LOZ43_000555 [Ophidiomyces ophidiicola]